MSAERKWIRHTVVAALLAVVLGGAGACYRSRAFDDTVTFTGTVYAGHTDAESGALVIDAPLPQALVTCRTYPESTRTDGNGSFRLAVTAPRRFQGPGYDTYVLVTTANSGGTGETTVNGRPGATIHAGTIIVH